MRQRATDLDVVSKLIWKTPLDPSAQPCEGLGVPTTIAAVTWVLLVTSFFHSTVMTHQGEGSFFHHISNHNDNDIKPHCDLQLPSGDRLSSWGFATASVAYLIISAILIHQLTGYCNARAVSAGYILCRRVFRMASSGVGRIMESPYYTLRHHWGYTQPYDGDGAIIPGGSDVKRASSPGSDGFLPGISNRARKTHLNHTFPPGLGNWNNSCYQNSVIQARSIRPKPVSVFKC